MKKTLLFFLLLFTNYFYAQVNDIEHCYQNTQFDLTVNQSLLLGNLNPAETTISYHLSSEDATANINAIVQPTAYSSSALSKTIYARIDNQGTVTTKFFNIKVYQELTFTTLTSSVHCNGQNDGSLTVVPSGGKTPYAYSLDGGPFTVYIGNPIGNFTNLSAGTHNIILKDALGCPSMRQIVQITEPTALIATTAVSNQNVIVTATGGTVPYQYSLDGMNYQISDVFQVITPGNYTPRVRDSNGCMVMVPVTVLPPLNATVAVTKEIDCNSGAILTVTASGGQLPYQYSIDGGATFQTYNVFGNLPGKTYNIVVKDAVNTVSNGTPIVLYPPFPIGVNTIVSPISCTSNAIITVIPTGAYGPFFYSLDGGINYSSNNTFSNLLAGTYRVVVKDQKNCVSSIFNVTINPFIPVSGTASNTQLVCAQDSAALTVNANGGQLPYQYSINDNPYTTSNVYTNISPGTYNIKVKDANNCLYTFVYNVVPPQNIIGAINIVNQTVTVTNVIGGSGSYMYSLDNGSFQINPVFTNLTPGTHLIKIKDSTGCESTYAISFIIEDLNPLTSTMTITKSIDCMSNAVISIAAAGGQVPYTYSIDGGTTYQTNSIFNNLVAGTYTIVVKDAANNTKINTFIIPPYSPLISTFSYTNVRCIGSNDGSVEITATGGKAPYVYSLDNNPYSSSNITSNLAASNYTINVKDANGCLFTSMVTISQPDALSASTTVKGTSANTNDGEITVTPFGGVAPYVYSIADNTGLPVGPFQVSNVFTGLKAGSYIVKVRDANGCEFNSVTITVESPSPLTAKAVITKKLDCISNATITATATGGQSPYTYSVDGGATYQSGNIFINLVAGTYNVIVKDAANTISNTNTIAINQPPKLAAFVAVSKPLDCNTSAIISAIEIGGTAPYLYSIDNGPYGSSKTFNKNAGTYTVNIKDAAGCIVSSTVTVAPYVSLFSTIAIANVKCPGGNDGSIVISASGGVSPYTYSIGSGFQASNIFNNLVAGNYVVLVKDKLGCVLLRSIKIIQPAAITITADITNATCYDSTTGEITINASGGTYPYTYSIDGNVYSQNNTFTYLAAKVYNLYVKDNRGCIASFSATITQPDALALDIDVKSLNNDGAIGGLIKLNASGGKAPYLYSVRNDTQGTQVSLNQNIRLYSGMFEGSYTISVTDANGCKITKTNVIVAITNPIVLNAVKTPISCIKNASLVVNASGGVAPYLYSYDSGVTYTSNNPGRTNLTPGTYSMLLKDAIGNEAQSYIIVKPYVPVKTTATVSYETADGYVDGVIKMSSSNGVAPYTYKVKDSATGKVIFDNSLSVGYVGLPEGTYSITAKDANGCESQSVDATLVLPGPISISISNINPITCQNPGESLTLNASGGTAPYLYSFNAGVTYRTINSVANLQSGSNYIFYAKDAIGNTSRITYKVKTYVPLTLDLTKSDVNCNGAQDGTIVANVAGGTSPYTYSLGAVFTSSKIFSNLPAGSYNVTVKDATGCTTISSVTITQPTLLAISTSIVNATTTNGGKITVTASGGNLPYTYSLQNNNGSVVMPSQTSNIFTDLTPGSYSVKVTDSRECIILQSGINISSPSPLVATYTVIPISCDNPAMIMVIVAGGTAPYTYSFDNGNTYSASNIFSTFTPGNYDIKVRDAQNNITSLVAVLSPLDPLSIIANVVSSVTCSQNGIIECTVFGGRAPYEYSLNGGVFQTSNTFNVPAGFYTISARDTSGCIVMIVVELKQPEPLVASLNVEDHTATITVAGGSGPYYYAISPNLAVFTGNNTFTNLAVGNYSAIVQNKYGCYMIFSFVIEPPAPLSEGKNATTFEFKPGQTLADLIVEGENIQWYSSQNPSGGKNNKANETPLPLTTALVDGITYYASQTINGVESKERLAVTAKSNGSLSTPDFVLPNFKYYPNPVKHLLTINNTAVIDEIEIYAVSGQSILSKRIDSDHAEIDLSNVSAGLYFLKVKSEGQVKIVKLVKK
ncbi:T9SS type A sorting domain-containing protein [Flavobacterium pectinovorum]|uniref:T9SS C-terminal target domain-containing protein n=1 Tax=Flavobacterium pectinovorum TaxID=29533 RepID=A0A502F2F0_9FLAO|nr:T9SS type A sorting domain-containing protein [Flavobacterium pectinovorum]TPG44395.1 T9SS C-terminal target domain-containing protein [Flavobacterium pectinovorum]